MADYAIFQTGGKQYRAKIGDIIKVEKLKADPSSPKGSAAAGGKVEFDRVMMVGDNVGSPVIAGAKVVGEVLEQKRGDKVLVFKKKRRHNYRRTKGHRQHITVVKITEIKA